VAAARLRPVEVRVLASALSVGDVAVWPGQGVVHALDVVERDGRRFWRLRAPITGVVIGAPVEKVAALLRPVAARRDADEALAHLAAQGGAVDERHTALRVRDASKALVRGALDDQARALHDFYRQPFALGFAEHQVVRTLEQVAVGEIAHAIGAAFVELVGELHAVHAPFAPDAPRRPPEPPLARPTPRSPVDVPAARYLGAFRVDGGALVAGEWTTSAAGDAVAVVVPAPSGAWHAFVQAERGRGLVAVHEAHVADFRRLVRDARPHARVRVTGGGATIVDAAMRDDASLADDAMFPLFAAGLLLDRGCHARTGGDGVFPVRTVARGGRTVFVAFGFDDA
jgi:hypothetical protein